ncbi:MAG TPA: hypothetical protein VMC79_02595 [Rectinemataceae bacterium]|nr:hypothetical protein [Rectinemataceae bacterium]
MLFGRSGRPTTPRRGAEGLSGRSLKDRLTFSDDIRATTAAINRLCGKRLDERHFFFDGHVSGIKNLVYNKAIDMALLYRATCSGSRSTRLVALARLRDEAFNYQGLEMPYNTRRILIALMKETVKARGDLLRQHRYMAAFHQALSGRAYVVRTMLNELGLAEVPEARSRGSAAQATGWDDHVYDNAGPGRKTPAQLVLDAYIKGLSRLTIVYEDFFDIEALTEALEAGRLMDVDVTLGLECLVQGKHRSRLYHVILLEDCHAPEKLKSLFESRPFRQVLRLVESNFTEYDRIYDELIDEFNRRSLPAINYGFHTTAGELKPLSLESLRTQARGRQVFHEHLGQLLRKRLADLREVRSEIDPGAERLDELGAAELRRRYFDPLYRDILGRGAFVRAERLYEAVREANADHGSRVLRIAYTRPLVAGLESCVRHLLGHARSIDALEVWNNRVWQEGYVGDTKLLESLRRALNAGDAGAAGELLGAKGIGEPDAGVVAAAAAHYAASPLEARIGSNSDGYNHNAPGMGFLPKHAVRNWRAVLRTNRSSPLPVTVPLASSAGAGTARRPTGRRAQHQMVILPLGRNRSIAGHRTAGAPELLRSLPGRLPVWRDLNASIRDLARMVAGGLIALLVGLGLSMASGFPPAFGLSTVFAFFAITYLRNFVVDQSAMHGLHPSRWRLSSFDATNGANSVFFSLLSIPLLRIVEQVFDYLAFGRVDVSGSMGSLGLRTLRFVLLALVNGAYMYGHNSLRGFTAPVKRTNFLRSVFAFPLAIALSYLNSLTAGISGALISKFASDIVGGITEMTFKILRETRRARQLYGALLPLLRGRAESKRAKVEQRIAILDILYVWGNSPRGKEALRRSVLADPAPELLWKRLQTPVRRYESFERLITDKTSWRKPQRIKLEFLRLAAAFSYWLERNMPA